MSLIALLFMALSASAAESNLDYTYIDENRTKATLSIYDELGITGEELVTLKIPGYIPQSSKPASISETDIEADVVIQKNGRVVADLSLAISFGTSFVQLKSLLADTQYRSAFSYLPESCSEQDVGFIIVNNNLDSNMRGYCLTPKPKINRRRGH